MEFEDRERELNEDSNDEVVELDSVRESRRHRNHRIDESRGCVMIFAGRGATINISQRAREAQSEDR